MKKVWQWTMGCRRKIPGPLLIILAVGVFCILVTYLYCIGVEKGFLQAIDRNGTRTLILLLAGIIGWYFLYQRTTTAKQNTKIAEQGLIVDRLNRATEQLAHKEPSVRLGGILGLEQIAKTHEEERKKIARILVSFICTRARKNSKETKKDLIACNFSKLKKMSYFPFSTYRAQRLDVESAIHVLASIASELEQQGEFREEYNEEKYRLCDLQNTDLRGLRIAKIDLSKFDFTRADMRGISLIHVNLSEADLSHANFYDVYHLKDTKFNGACLFDAIFIKARIFGIDFRNAELGFADFTGASLGRVKIEGATLDFANFTGAKLSDMHGLQQHQLDKTFRWKGYKTSVSSADGKLLEPSPEDNNPEEFEFYTSPKSEYEWGVYKNVVNEWRWIRSYSDRGIDSVSKETYKNKADCIANAKQNGMDFDPSQLNND